MKKMLKFNNYKLYEFEEVDDVPYPEYAIYMDKIRAGVDDLRITISMSGDKINFDVYPTQGPSYEFSYGFNKSSVDEILKLIDSAFDEDPNKGIVPEPKGKTYKYDTEEQSKTVKEEEIEPLDIPIKKKPVKRKRSIDINIIQDVLEDAYILEDIELKDTSVDELIRRMLLETRSRSKRRK